MAVPAAMSASDGSDRPLASTTAREVRPLVTNAPQCRPAIGKGPFQGAGRIFQPRHDLGRIALR